jgi:hypothetical protein
MKQIPCGRDRKKGTDKSRSLRDDNKKGNGNGNSNSKSKFPSGMTNNGNEKQRG